MYLLLKRFDYNVRSEEKYFKRKLDWKVGYCKIDKEV